MDRDLGLWALRLALVALLLGAALLPVLVDRVDRRRRKDRPE